MPVISPTTKFNHDRKILALDIAQLCANLLIKEFGAKKVRLSRHHGEKCSAMLQILNGGLRRRTGNLV
jgi:hypothetical protein